MNENLDYSVFYQVEYTSGPYPVLEGRFYYRNDNFKEIEFFRKIAMQTGLEGASVITGKIIHTIETSTANAKSFEFTSPEIKMLMEKI